MGYEECTWEIASDIQDAIRKFEKRRRVLRCTNGTKQLRPALRPVETISNNFGATMHKHQLSAVNWLLGCWSNGRNSVLVDEAGLGKTADVVVTLELITGTSSGQGPFMILTKNVNHWKQEFDMWIYLNTVIYSGPEKAKKNIRDCELFVCDRCGKGKENAAGVDDGHRLSNPSCQCYQHVSRLTAYHCTLVTGESIQTNVEKL
jgi:hypothetical protein